VQVGTYPTRNFALALTRIYRADSASYLLCTAPSLHVAMQRGPSHHPSLHSDVRRMVSEDSGSSRETNRSFLLIVRTGRFVTARERRASSAGYSEFPAYSRMHTAPLPARGAAIYLRHSCYSSARAEWLGRFGSAQLSTSPWRSDHLIARVGRLAYGL
jgi:hypothetical protein